MPTIRVKSSSGSCDVLCARDALSDLRPVLKRLDDVSEVFILSSPRVWRACGNAVAAKLPADRQEQLMRELEEGKEH